MFRPALIKRFPDDEACAQYLYEKRWPDLRSSSPSQNLFPLPSLPYHRHLLLLSVKKLIDSDRAEVAQGGPFSLGRRPIWQNVEADAEASNPALKLLSVYFRAKVVSAFLQSSVDLKEGFALIRFLNLGMPKYFKDVKIL